MKIYKIYLFSLTIFHIFDFIFNLKLEYKVCTLDWQINEGLVGRWYLVNSSNSIFNNGVTCWQSNKYSTVYYIFFLFWHLKQI